MPEIGPSVMVHKLNVLPTFPPIHQKKRVFAQKQDQAKRKKSTSCKMQTSLEKFTILTGWPTW